MEGQEDQPEFPSSQEDPCDKVKCGAGSRCVWEDGDEGEIKAKCACVDDCGAEVDPRRMVCSNHNETFPSECHLHRARCICQQEGAQSNRCQDEKHLHAHVDYFGECRVIPACDPEDRSDFPRRMREWLYNVMEELSERGEISQHYAKEIKDKVDPTVGWRHAAVWKWCDLDLHPHDNAVSRHELFPVRAPLQALEHCISDFLDDCDADSDHLITLKEWGKCLELKEEELVAECEKIGDNDGDDDTEE